MDKKGRRLQDRIGGETGEGERKKEREGRGRRETGKEVFFYNGEKKNVRELKKSEAEKGRVREINSKSKEV